jgi:hypothetical protein
MIHTKNLLALSKKCLTKAHSNNYFKVKLSIVILNKSLLTDLLYKSWITKKEENVHNRTINV